MPGETDLIRLLKSMAPELAPQCYVFCTTDKSFDQLAALNPWALIREGEGLSVILEQDMAVKTGLANQIIFRRITLNVHSSLEAVGLTAAVATALAETGISANVVAGYFHDHIFVPEDKSELAISVLRKLSEKGPL